MFAHLFAPLFELKLAQLLKYLLAKLLIPPLAYWLAMGLEDGMVQLMAR